MDKFRTIECECGNKITYLTLRNQINCQMCNRALEVEPCQEEDFEQVKSTVDETTEIQEGV